MGWYPCECCEPPAPVCRIMDDDFNYANGPLNAAKWQASDWVVQGNRATCPTSDEISPSVDGSSYGSVITADVEAGEGGELDIILQFEDLNNWIAARLQFNDAGGLGGMQFRFSSGGSTGFTDFWETDVPYDTPLKIKAGHTVDPQGGSLMLELLDAAGANVLDRIGYWAEALTWLAIHEVGLGVGDAESLGDVFVDNFTFDRYRQVGQFETCPNSLQGTTCGLLNNDTLPLFLLIEIPDIFGIGCTGLGGLYIGLSFLCNGAVPSGDLPLGVSLTYGVESAGPAFDTFFRIRLTVGPGETMTWAANIKFASNPIRPNACGWNPLVVPLESNTTTCGFSAGSDARVWAYYEP